MGRKYVVYATPEKVEQINPKNMEIWRRYINGKRTLAESSKKNYESDINQFFCFSFIEL